MGRPAVENINGLCVVHFGTDTEQHIVDALKACQNDVYAHTPAGPARADRLPDAPSVFSEAEQVNQAGDYLASLLDEAVPRPPARGPK